MFILLVFLLAIDPRYHTAAEVAAELDSIAQHHPDITLLDTIGYSTQDSLLILAMKISDNAGEDEDEPEVLYVACHHAEELLGVEICMYMINDLIENYNIDSLHTYWVNNREIWIVPLLNPEGHTVVMRGIDTTWRKNKHDNNHNGIFDLDYDGVDPNRNYDFHWAEGGNNNPASEYYRGEKPFSEKENQALKALCEAHSFVFCNTYHSARTGLGEVVYFPWVWSGGYSPDFPVIRSVADSMSKLIINDAGNGHYTALPGEGLDGKARNWLYAVCGTFTFCVEVSTTTIQPGWMVDDICQRNLVGAYYLLERMNYAAVTGITYDAETGEPLSAEVIIDGYYDPDLPPRRSDSCHGRFLRILSPGSYNITIKKPGYEPEYLQGVEVTSDKTTELDIPLKKIENSFHLNNDNDTIIIYPNPTRNRPLTIRIKDPVLFQSLRIYDVCGRVLKNFNQPINTSLCWTGDDDLNRQAGSGIYYIVGEYSDTEESSVRRAVGKIILLD
ncbi:MAG TPA: PEGA domain-containing protein [candidate division WOR-3 bacterium]|uniref:PEGA domain-containing protein n=1 Tax=candidate division WOR-3 bacterium TaxID=2052148 RepID=A0A9C9ELR5_UNCW3|nr:PEGA domain-containing protein [candidate division WOR-3 bacterium]